MCLCQEIDLAVNFMQMRIHVLNYVHIPPNPPSIMKSIRNCKPSGYAVAFSVALTFATSVAWAQQATPAPKKSPDPKDDEALVLSPFEVSASNNNGYAAATTLAGNRLNTELRDIGNAVTVITAQFLKDIGATDNQTLLQYTTNTEVGNAYGNFAGNGDGASLDESPHFINPNQNTRVRGLTSADNTRDYFLTDIPWEGYNIDGVDLQRGPNSILFGQGSPAGIINTRTKQASLKDSNEVTFRVGSFGSNRTTLDINHVLIKNELALRFDAVRNDEKYKQDPAFSKNERAFGAIRWEPGFLKKGSARTIFKANVELGKVTSNNVRNIPPIDKITPWFLTGTYVGKNVANQPFTYNNLNKVLLNPQQNEDDNTGLANHGQNRPSHNGPSEISGTPNQYYNPWVGNFGNQYGNPTAFYNNNTPGIQGAFLNWEPQGNHGIGPTGAIDKNVGGIPYQRPAGVSGYAQFAKNAKLPYSEFGIYKDKTLTDPTVFDFYNQLLDGPNKKEWQNFRTYNLTLSQTFFHDHMGFEGTYNGEWYKSGATSLLDGNGTQSIGIDMSSTYSDGSNNGQAAPFNGTPNPNVGRAYLSSASQYGNNSYVSNRLGRRFTVFGKYNFDDGERRNWFTRFLGEHTVTGLANEDLQSTDRRSWQLYGTDAAYEAFVNELNPVSKVKFTDNRLTPNTTIYLGKSLMSASSASGIYLPSPSTVMAMTSGTVRTFDSTWNKPTSPTAPGYVNPAAYWHNDYYPALNPITGAPMTQGDNTQSENPANYVGFRNVPLTIIDSGTSQANRDLLTHDASLTKSLVTSTAATWQGHFWNNAFVATWGVRKDIARSWSYSANVNSKTSDAYGHLNFDPSTYKLKDTPNQSLEVQSHAWTAVTHLNELGVLKKLPLQVSLFYNRSTDFQPSSQRVDAYGDPLGPPSGLTKDMGILLETKDGKYSLKINKYETTSTSASSSALGGSWFIGTSQAWAGNWVNRFEFNWTNDTINGAVTVNDPTNSMYNYGQAPGETLVQAQAREAAAISAYRVWQKSVNPKFFKAWGLDLNDRTKALSASTPNGFAVTEDSVSKGYEIEFNAVPTKNWRLTFNASKTKAIRTNIGGTALSEFVASYEKALKTTAAGDVRVWWGGAGNETSLFQWNSNIGSEYAQRKLQEGTNVPELREWRFNAITNYDFDHGRLKGFNIGGGLRYESNIVIGYKPLPGATANDISFDIGNPYKGPAETNYDFWAGYSRRIWKKIDWNIQLNVRNAFVGNELIPLTTQPDGTYATYRIKPPQTWQLTNSFKF